MFSSAPEGLSQLDRMVRRDRNHPSVVFWSTGNEEAEQSTDRGARMCTTTKRLVKRLDPTRPITQAMNAGFGEGISAVVDIQGFNYFHAPDIDAFHKKFPEKPCLGTEVASTVSTRGIYFNDPEKGYVSSYDVNYPPWALRRKNGGNSTTSAPGLPAALSGPDSTIAASPLLMLGPASTRTSALLIPAAFSKTSLITTRRGGAVSRCSIFSPTGIGLIAWTTVKANPLTSGSSPIWREWNFS